MHLISIALLKDKASLYQNDNGDAIYKTTNKIFKLKGRRLNPITSSISQLKKEGFRFVKYITL